MVLHLRFGPALGSNSIVMDDAQDSHELDLLLPQSVTRPLWSSLLSNLHDRFFPEKLPPLQLTSRPMNTGMLIGDAVSLPWFRTVFTNLGNVINPEILPPLELESQPVDVGELISDQMGHMWWTSLLRNLADRVAPERLPPLQLTSTPVDADLEIRRHATGALVFADHTAQSSTGGEAVLHRYAGSRSRAPHGVRSTARGICRNVIRSTRCASTCPSRQTANRSFAIKAEGRSSDRAGCDGSGLFAGHAFRPGLNQPSVVSLQSSEKLRARRGWFC